MTARVTDLLGSDPGKELDLSTADAAGLPGSAYGAQFFELERTQLFPRSWCAVAVGSDIPEPGDVLPVTLAGWPLLLVRDAEGAVRVFHNICRHRGMAVIERADRGRRHVSCPWHGWTYTLDGKLFAAPRFGGYRCQDRLPPELKEVSLKAVRSAVWLDYILVNLDGRAPEIGAYTSDLVRFIEPYDFGQFRYAGKWEATYQGNWKIAVEGGIEDYHLEWGHPEFMRGVSNHEIEIGIGQAMAGFAALQSFRNRNRAGCHLAPSLPRLQGFDPDGRVKYFILNLFPTAILLLEAHHAMLTLFVPRDWNRTQIVFCHYFIGQAATDPALAEARRHVEHAWALVGEQDASFVSTVHDNAQVRDEAGIRPRFSGYWEPAVHHFQRLVVQSVGPRADESEEAIVKNRDAVWRS